MSPALNTTLALLALGLAILAIVLATIANRRWAQRPVRGGGPGSPLHHNPAAGGPHQFDGETSTADGSDRDEPAALADRSDRQVLAAALASLRTQVEGLSAHVEDLATQAHVEDLATQTVTVRSDVEALRDRVEVLTARADEPRDPTALRHVALVRYDAFADVGGRLSYSVALLDDTSSGLVLTTLAGKADVRTYVRTISAGAPDGSLTAEEQQAIDAAVGSRQ